MKSKIPILILCGGRGERLNLKKKPKPMVNMNGFPLLRWQIEHFKNLGYNDFVLLTGYNGNIIKDYFEDGKKFGVSIKYSSEKKSLGTAGAVAASLMFIKKDFFLAYGDVLTNVHPTELYNFAKKNSSEVIISVHPNNHPEDSDIIEIDKNNKVLKVINKTFYNPKKNENLVNAAFYYFKNKKIFDENYSYINKDIGTDCIAEFIKKKKTIHALRTTKILKDIGTKKRLALGRKILKEYNFKSWSLRKSPAWILDRDNTIIFDNDKIFRASDVKLMKNSAKAIRKINDSFSLAICITNQPAIAKGFISFDTLNKINKAMFSLLSLKGSYLDKLYFCPHHPTKGYKNEIKNLKINCNCRKPKIGLFKKAIKENDIDLSNSYSVGDHARDIIASKKAKIFSIYIGSKKKYEDELLGYKNSKIYPDLYVDDLMDAFKQVGK